MNLNLMLGYVLYAARKVKREIHFSLQIWFKDIYINFTMLFINKTPSVQMSNIFDGLVVMISACHCLSDNKRGRPGFDSPSESLIFFALNFFPFPHSFLVPSQFIFCLAWKEGIQETPLQRYKEVAVFLSKSQCMFVKQLPNAPGC